MKTFVISLKSAENRRNYVEKHLKSLGLDFEIVDAVDGSVFSDIEKESMVEKNFLDKSKYHFSNGQIGCALSHLNVYQKIIDFDLDYALIVEDDIIFPDNINIILSTISQIENLDVVMLSFYSHRLNEPLKLSKKSLKSHEDLTLYKPVEIKKCASTMAYIISNKSAKKIVDANSPMIATADDWGKLHHYCHFENFYCLYPNITKEQEFTSTIDYKTQKSYAYKLAKFVKKNNIPILKQLLKLKNIIRTKQKHQIQLCDEDPNWQ